MDFRKAKKFLAVLAAIYWIFAALTFFAAGDQFRYTVVGTDTLSANLTIGEFVDGMTVTQRMIAPADEVTGLSFFAATMGRTNTGIMHASVSDAAGQVIANHDIDISQMEEGEYTRFLFDAPVYVRKGDVLTLTLTTTGCTYGNAVTIYCGNTVMTGRFDIAQSIAPEDLYTVNGMPGVGKLCVRMDGVRRLTFYRDYWFIMGGVFAAAVLLSCYWWKRGKEGHNNPLVMVCTMVTRYGFLIRQLVSRDFKTKYKRSVLGMAWSFLNPLLTMSVQYVVFSTLFKSDIPNYPVYLLSGIVFFNFFNEAVGMCMTSITSNASLIKKVYMPKYIYPVSRILSSLVNFVLAIIPLFIVMIVTGTRFTPALLLLVFDIMCLLGFVLGMGLLLTTCMTFFQDTQFLWGVVSMMWMYLTPIFYPEKIIPVKFLTLYHMNPMYQYITFARICIIDGVSPEPMAYLWCIISSLVVLTLGILVFKRNQDKFVLYL